MAQWMRAKSSEMVIKVTGWKRVLRSARERSYPLVHGQASGVNKHSSVVVQVGAVNSHVHWLRITSTTREADRAGKVSAAIDTSRLE